MKRANLKTNFILNIIVQSLNLIVPIITAPYLARVLHEEGNGIYSYSFSIITYFVLFANLGFAIYGQREIARNSENKELQDKRFWEIFLVKFFTTSISTIVLAIILLTVGFGQDYNLVILILGIQVVGVAFDINFYFQGTEDFKSIAIKQIILKLLSIIMIFIFVKNENDVWVYALCLSSSIILANITMWPRALKRIKFTKIEFSGLCKHFRPAILVFLPTLAVTIYSVFDKTMIGLLSSNPKYDNGCYEQAYKINSMALIAVTVITAILIPRNSSDYANGRIDEFNGHIKFAINYVWMIGLPLMVGFVFLSKNLSSWFLGDGYDSVPLMLSIMSVRFILSGFGEILGSQIFIATGNEKYPTIATFIGALINVILNYFFIKLYGAVGAAITTAICEFVVTTILMVFAVKKKFISIKYVFTSMWKYLIATIVMGAIIWFTQKNMNYSIMSFFVIVIEGIAVYFICLCILEQKFFLKYLYKLLSSISIIIGKIFASGPCIKAESNNSKENNNE